MRQHYHDINNNPSATPSCFLQRLENAKNNNASVDDISPFDLEHNQFTFLESLTKRAEHKHIKNLKGLVGTATSGS